MKITKTELKKIIKEELLKEYGRTTSGLPFIDAYLGEIDKEVEEVIKIEDPIDRQWEMARRLATISGKMKSDTEHFVKSLDALVDNDVRICYENFDHAYGCLAQSIKKQ